MLDRFNALLQSLSAVIDLPLRVDKHHACAIQLKEGLIVQLQSDIAQEKLLISCKIIELPPGIFRENVLKEALKANSRPDPVVGIFSYIEQINALFLFQRYPFDMLDGAKISGLIGPFFQTAESWQTAIASGKAAPPFETLT
jgi:hypothetical protein